MPTPRKPRAKSTTPRKPRAKSATPGPRRKAPARKPVETAASEVLARRIAAFCRDKKGEDVLVLDVRGLADYMDFMVLATGLSERSTRAITDHIVRSLRGEKIRPLSVSGADGGTWICVDFVDVVLHVFDRATRLHYDLELLWADAPRLAIADVATA